MTEQKNDLVQSLVEHYIYRPHNPDWANLQVALYDYGYTAVQVYEIMNDVREGETQFFGLLTEG